MGNSDAKGFGATLRRAREESGRDVRDVAEVTRIQARYIEALEAEDWSGVPRGVIGRGFVRVIARELGAPAPELLALYRAARGDDDAEPERSLPETEWKVSLGGHRRWKPFVVAAAAALVLAVGVWRWAPPSGGQRQASQPPSEKEAGPAATLTPPGDQAEAPPAPAVEAPGAPTAAARPGPAAEGRLEIEARGRVWVRVQPAGGEAEERILKPGERVSFSGASPFEVKVSDGGAVSLYWNGQALGPAGKPSQVASLSVPEAGTR